MLRSSRGLTLKKMQLGQGGKAMSEPLPAVAKADAVDETAEIFDDIRRVLQVSVVNLVRRHLASSLCQLAGRAMALHGDCSQQKIRCKRANAA
jgi:hypothetical protein